TVYAQRNTSDVDLIFGGGSAVFDGLNKLGYLEAPNPPLTPEMIAGMSHTPDGPKLYGANNLWIAATMSNFGFVVNKTRLTELHLARPTTWKDLTGPGWIDNLAVADPSKSGSVATCYEMILQQYGWKEGWPVLTKIFANAESIQISGPAPGDEAGSGNAVAGIVIDFYGRTAIIKQGSDLMEFIVPAGGSTLDPDPIAILKGAPSPTLASHFLEFVASASGQRLWIQCPGTPGGPERKALGRMSTIPQLYETAAPYLTDPTNPFATPAGNSLHINEKLKLQRTSFIGEVIKSALIDNHTELQAARRAIRAAGDPPELLALFDQLPFDESETAKLATAWKEKSNQPALRNQWRQQFHDLFDSIREKAAHR
ncbi:MAG: ABC transporter substrate-binding protein, partial [Phycisphaerae bacterium]